MTREDVRRFVDRDWARVSAAKDRAWLAAKRDNGAADALRAGDQLRRFARSVRADWPDLAHRTNDRQTHVRVSEALGAVRIRPR